MAGVKWRAVVYERTDPNGKQIRRQKKGTARNKTEAKAARDEAMVQLRKDVRESRQTKGTVAELAADYVRIKSTGERALTTNYAEALKANRIIEDLGHIQLRHLTARHLDNWYHELLTGTKTHKPLSVTTVRHYHTLLKAMLTRAYNWDLVPGNVAVKASPPSKPRADVDVHHKTLTPAALRNVIDTCRPSLKMCALLAIATGCRRGEILALRWSSLNGDLLLVDLALAKVPGRDMIAKAPKSGHRRTIKLPPGMVPILEAHRASLAVQAAAAGVELAGDGPIIADMRADPTGRTPHDPKWLTQAWANHCKRQGVEFRYHDLRHAHASHLIGHGIDPAAAAARLGHASSKMTLDTYSKALTQNDDRAAAVIGELMFGGVSS